jgi:hypothetical protein
MANKIIGLVVLLDLILGITSFVILSLVIIWITIRDIFSHQ